MAVLIDASILIEAERGRLHLEPHVARHGEEEAFLSVVTAERVAPRGASRRPAGRARPALGFRRGHPRALPAAAVDLACARAHAQIWAELSRAGTIIGPHDLWLAATCVAHGLTMVTANVREFARVPGL